MASLYRASGNINAPIYFAFIGLVLQLMSLTSNSWVRVECIQTLECPHRKVLLETGPGCKRIPYKRAEIARAGLWTVCYQFPHLEPGHTDPYCSYFSDDFDREELLLMAQMMCILSVCMTGFGLLAFSCDRILKLKNNAFSSSGFAFLGVAGFCGVAGCTSAHLCLTQEYVVLHYWYSSVLFKWWAFHLFLDCSIVNLSVWLLSGWNRRKLYVCLPKHW
ncbi:hypothetical protein BsWGS_05958 [Bradybaena similaris]